MSNVELYTRRSGRISWWTAGKCPRHPPHHRTGFLRKRTTAEAIANAAADRRLAKSHVTVQMGGVRAANSFYQTAPTPNLIIIESLSDRDAMLADLDHLAQSCDAGTKVLVIGAVNDVVLYRALMQRGVSEYMVAPLQPAQIIESIGNLYEDPSAEPAGEVIAFVGAKGGLWFLNHLSQYRLGHVENHQHGCGDH